MERYCRRRLLLKATSTREGQRVGRAVKLGCLGLAPKLSGLGLFCFCFCFLVWFYFVFFVLVYVCYVFGDVLVGCKGRMNIENSVFCV